MGCKEIQNKAPSSLFEAAPFPSLNAPLKNDGDISRKGSSYFVCDDAKDYPLLAKASSGPGLQKSAALFAPKAALPHLSPLPPPPSSDWARLLYDLTTQLNDFELTTTLRMPVEGISDRGPVQTLSRAVIKDQGALIVLNTE